MFAFTTSERFARLDARDRERLDALSRVEELSAGTEIGSDAKPIESLYLVAKGRVELLAKTPGAETALFAVAAGDVFGELETFAELPAGMRYVTREATAVRSLPKAVLKHELRAHRTLATGLLFAYCHSISEKVRAVSEAAARRAPSSSPSPPPGGRPRQSHLAEDAVGWLSVMGQKVAAAPGEAVVAEGDTTRSFYVIESGEVEVRKRTPGGDKPLAVLSTRDLFGLLSFIDGRPRSASVVALKPSQLVRIEADALEKAMGLNFTVSFKFLGALCGVLGKTFRDTALQFVA